MYFSQLQSLTGELESHLSPEMMSLKSSLKPYLDSLTPKHATMASLFREVSQEGAELTDVFKPTKEVAGDSGRAGRISSQISNLDTHCRRVEQLWQDAQERVRRGERHPSQTGLTTGQTSSKSGQSSKKKQATERKTRQTSATRGSKTGQTGSARTSKTGQPTAAKSSNTSRTGSTRTSKPSQTTAGPTDKSKRSAQKQVSLPTTKLPPSEPSSLKTHNGGPSSKTRSSARKQSEMYGDLEAEAYRVSIIYCTLFCL